MRPTRPETWPFAFGCSVLDAFVAALALTVDVRAQWEVIVLHPEEAYASTALAASGARRGGRIEVWDAYRYWYHPVIWNVSPGDYVDLLAHGWRIGVVNGMDANSQVGYVGTSPNYYPNGALWRGTAESLVILTPPGFTYSVAYDVAGDEQVGYVGPTGPLAAAWRGSPETYINLHPPTARWSEALATDGVQQGGRASFPSPPAIHAVLWRGSAESFIDMNPPGGAESVIEGMAPGVEVGSVSFGGNWRASLWGGTPESWRSLHPPGASNSFLEATSGTRHVGNAFFNGELRGGIWMNDAPTSFVDLHRFLAPGWSRSAPKAIAEREGHIYVGGAALAPDGRAKAVLWIGRVAQAQDDPGFAPSRTVPPP